MKKVGPPAAASLYVGGEIPTHISGRGRICGCGDPSPHIGVDAGHVGGDAPTHISHIAPCVGWGSRHPHIPLHPTCGVSYPHRIHMVSTSYPHRQRRRRGTATLREGDASHVAFSQRRRRRAAAFWRRRRLTRRLVAKAAAARRRPFRFPWVSDC